MQWDESVDACPFCKEEVHEKQAIYRGEHTLALYCLTPAIEGHILIIPKRHVLRFEQLLSHELEEIRRIVARAASIFIDHLGATDYIVLQKNGMKAGQTVPHLHFHAVPSHTSIQDLASKGLIERDAISDEEMVLKVKEFQDYFYHSK